jgi:hypothetical protein
MYLIIINVKLKSCSLVLRHLCGEGELKEALLKSKDINQKALAYLNLTKHSHIPFNDKSIRAM